jgi:hypothetical protein
MRDTKSMPTKLYSNLILFSLLSHLIGATYIPHDGRCQVALHQQPDNLRTRLAT